MSVWTIGNVLLSRKLTTEMSFVPWLQLAIAAVMLAVVADGAGAPVRRRSVVLALFGHLATLAGLLLAYSGFHAALFGTMAG